MTEMKKSKLVDLHTEHKSWNNQLDFCEDEIKAFESRLEELVQRYTGSKVLAEIEQYQNKFIREKEVIDILRHKIGLQHRELEQFSRQHPGATELFAIDGHLEIKGKMSDFNRIYSNMKVGYQKLLLKLL